MRGGEVGRARGRGDEAGTSVTEDAAAHRPTTKQGEGGFKGEGGQCTAVLARYDRKGRGCMEDEKVEGDGVGAFVRVPTQ